jgi:GWxTD domain-containing protein
VPKAYRDWIDKDVDYIITSQERDAFKKLKTNEEREQFIEMFWRRRDPDPDTDENEYREEYYERIAYANEHFSSGVPGWKTDRGRIYIMYGKADEIETHPMGGGYERPSYHGGGSTSTYPFEVWFYRYLPGIGSGIEIEFVDPTGSGEYRIARSPDEKDALLNIPGAGLTLAEQLGLSNKADRISGMGGNSFGYQRAQDSPFERLLLLSQLNQAPQIKFKELEGQLAITGGGRIDENPLNFDVRIDFFRQSDERVVTAITVQTDNKDLVFQDSGGLQRARLNIFGRIIAVSGRRIGVFEDPVETTASPEELADAKDRKSAYQKAIPLAPGTYKVEVVVRDITSGATGVRKVGFTVPKYDAKQLNTSTLVLASKLENIDPSREPTMFTIGQTKVVPNLSRNYRRGQPMGIYMQVYNVGTDQTTLRPSVDVQYVLMKDGKEVSKTTEDWQGLADYGQRLTLARLINTNNLPVGEYTIEIRIRDRVSNQSLSKNDSFTVSQ